MASSVAGGSTAMKLVVSICTSISLALAMSSAPASAQPDKQAPAEVTPSEAQSWISLFGKVVDTVVAHREQCSKMSTSLNAVIDANQQTIAMAKDAKAKGKRLPARAQQEMMDGLRRMVAALDKCGRDEAVAAAFKRLDLGGRT
jgi:hypothetical protein